MAEYSNYMWSVPDWRTDEMYIELDNREQGIYRNLLDECFLAGSITSDPVILARFVREPLDYFNGVWAKIQKKFRPLHNGERLTNPRMNIDRRRLQTIRKNRKKSASHAAKVKWNNIRQQNALDAERINPAMRVDAHSHSHSHSPVPLLKDLSLIQDSPLTHIPPNGARARRPPKVRAVERELPADFEVTPKMQEWFDNHDPPFRFSMRLAHEQFIAWAQSNGIRKTNWEATWKNWMLSPHRNVGTNGNGNGTHKESYAERVARRNREITLEIDQQLSGTTGDSSRNGSDEGTAGVVLPGLERHR